MTEQPADGEGAQPEEELSEEEIVEQIYAYASGLAAEGKTRFQIETALIEQGLERDAAVVIATNIMNVKKGAENSAGTKNLIWGAIWCFGGIAVTAATYSSASGGGTYLVAWGAIIFGAIQMIRGLIQMVSS